MSWIFKKFNKTGKVRYNEHKNGEKMEIKSEAKEGPGS